MNIFLKWSMYIMSYLPLYILILLQHITDVMIVLREWIGIDKFTLSNHLMQKTLIIFCVSLIIWSMVTLLILFKNRSIRNEQIGIYEDAGEGTLNYLATFIVPMISLNVNDLNTLVANLFLFLILGQLYTMGDLLYLNPVFTIFGFHIIRDTKTKSIIFSRIPISRLIEVGQSDLNKIEVSILGSSNIRILKKVIIEENDL